MSLPILRIVGGALLILAGILAYIGVNLGLSVVALVLVGGGAAVLVVAMAGHRPRGWDVAIFIIGLLAVSGAAVGYGYRTQLTSYSATRTQVPSGVISLQASSSFGSVSVAFTNRADLAYQVNFSRQLGSFPPWPMGTDSVTNSTSGGVFNLKVESASSDASIVLGRGYVVDIDVMASAGSVSLSAAGTERIRSVSLSASTGSVSAIVDSVNIQKLVVHADLGSVSLVSNHLGTTSASVPITLSASTGSVSMRTSIQGNDAVSLTASTNLGSVSHRLTGFIITQDTQTSLVASAGVSGAAGGSFVITATSNLGSVDVTASLVLG